MLHPWIKEYILLALRIDRLVRKTGDLFVDFYIGPAELRKKVEEEKELTTADLLAAAVELTRSLSGQNFTEQRTVFLMKQVRAMETTLRILNDEPLSFNQQVKNCLDITPRWVPEEELKEGLALFEEGLPGNGDLLSRFNQWYQRNIYIFKNKQQKLELLNTVVEEVNRRTSHIFDLPREEEIKLELVSDQQFGAASWYLGNYHSLVQINDDLPPNIFYLLPLISHELYPGHHTESSLKESNLLQKLHYQEQQVFILNSPQLVITEGIAETAFEMIFTPEEAAHWMVENLYNRLDIKTDDVDLACLIRASRTNSLDQLGGNTAVMLNQGRSEEEIKDFLKKYTLQPEAMLNHVVSRQKSLPLKRIYTFAYYNGRRIIKDILDQQETRQQQVEVFNRLLTEQVYPSMQYTLN